MQIFAQIRACKATILSFVGLGFAVGSFAALVPVLKDRIGASDAEYGLTFLISSLGALAAMWTAPVIDRWLGRRAMQISAVFMGFAVLLPAFASNVAMFAILMFLFSATVGTTDVLMNARVSEAEARTGHSLMGLNHGMYSFAYAGAAIVTGMAREAGMGPFAIFGIMAVAILILCLWMQTEQGHIDAPDSKKVPVGFTVTLIGVVVFIAFFAEHSVEGWSALHLERGLGGGAAEGAMGPAVLGITMGVGRVFGHTLTTWISERVLIGLAAAVSAAGLVLAATAQSLLLAYVGFAIMGLGVSVVAPLALGLAGQIVTEAQRVTAIARATVMGYVAFFVGPSAIGLTSDAFSLPTAFLIVAGFLIIIPAFLLPLISRRIRAGVTAASQGDRQTP